MKRTPAWESKDGGFHRHKHDAKKADAEYDICDWVDRSGLEVDDLALILAEHAATIAPLLAAYVKAEEACQVAEKAAQLADLVDDVARTEAAEADAAVPFSCGRPRLGQPAGAQIVALGEVAAKEDAR